MPGRRAASTAAPTSQPLPAGSLPGCGPATSAVLLQPGAVMVDTAGNVLICDTADGRIREVSGPAARLR
jgi:hypothetical protein